MFILSVFLSFFLFRFFKQTLERWVFFNATFLVHLSSVSCIIMDELGQHSNTNQYNLAFQVNENTPQQYYNSEGGNVIKNRINYKLYSLTLTYFQFNSLILFFISFHHLTSICFQFSSFVQFRLIYTIKSTKTISFQKVKITKTNVFSLILLFSSVQCCHQFQ